MKILNMIIQKCRNHIKAPRAKILVAMIFYKFKQVYFPISVPILNQNTVFVEKQENILLLI